MLHKQGRWLQNRAILFRLPVKENFRFSETSRHALGSTQPHIQCVSRALFPMVKRPPLKHDFHLHCGVKVDNEGGAEPLLLTYAFSPCTEVSITSLHQVSTDFSDRTFNYSVPGTHCLGLKWPEPVDNHFSPIQWPRLTPRLRYTVDTNGSVLNAFISLSSLIG